MICAIILAAGESKRMGKPKLLLPYGGKTIIETVIGNVVRSKVDKTLLVLGSDWHKIAEKIRKSQVSVTINPHYKRGMFSSVLHGLHMLPEKAQAVVMVLADQPGVPTSVIDSLIRAFQKYRKGIVLPIYKNERGHPVLIDLKYRKEIKKINLEKGLRELIYSHLEDIQEVKVSTPSILKDIDDRKDYLLEIEKVHL
jgi:molybdenum cofactor cytidylyltransferase